MRIIRSLQACTPQQLGHGATDDVRLRGKNGITYQINSVIGRGHFCTVFRATARSRAVCSPLVIKREKCDPVQLASTRKDRLSLIEKEVNILREFARSNSDNLPRLFDNQWRCSKRRMYIPMLPVGIPLEVHVTFLSSEGRRQQAAVLHRAVCQGLQAAHDLNWCHSDLRPQNVVFDQIKNTYCVIDWGLAVREGDRMHHYRGGLAFFHDDIVYACEEKGVHNWTAPAVYYYKQHHLASARYVVYAFVLGGKNLDVEWSELPAGPQMVTARETYMGKREMEQLLS